MCVQCSTVHETSSDSPELIPMKLKDFREHYCGVWKNIIKSAALLNKEIHKEDGLKEIGWQVARK